MKRIVLLAAIVVPAFVGLVAQASSAPPDKSNLSISAKPAKVTFGQATVISGKAKGPPSGPISVTLQQNPYPYADGFEPVETKLSANNGDYVVRWPAAGTKPGTG